MPVPNQGAQLPPAEPCRPPGTTSRRFADPLLSWGVRGARRPNDALVTPTAHREIEENELERIASGFLCTSGHDILFGAGNR